MTLHPVYFLKKCKSDEVSFNLHFILKCKSDDTSSDLFYFYFF